MSATPCHREPLPWRDPWLLVQALASELGCAGLVWLDGDGSAQGNCSRLGLAPLEQRICRGLPGESEASDPFVMLADLAASGGHWMGWLSYEAGAWVEPEPHWQSPDMALLWAARHDPVLVFDHRSQQQWLEGQDRGLLNSFARLLAQLDLATPPERQAPAVISTASWYWHTPPERFAAQVEQVLAWIAAGDLFQANLTACCEHSLKSPADPIGLYGRLREICAAPFAGLAIAGGEAAGEAVLSASPERFLRVGADGKVETRPIKGTRPRHSDADADADAAAELVTSPKDRAENVMIVDLLRNDLGRVCKPGSILVPQLVGLESYRQVHHLTSVVQGQLEQGRNTIDLLRACWPGGSITGAPKIRACKRLNGLEPVPRGPYCGSLFRIGVDGQFDSNILIRSLLLRGQRLRAHAGCGIVADSNPAAEAEELGWKLQPLLEALA
ncbi:MAG: anthranilate synthase component I family protein [Cyanobacteria bacterium]|nr:anthranilate synthase component I family protein [Cyanobacteriota bacterium]